MPLQEKLVNQIKEKNIQFFEKRQFVLERGEIKSHNFNIGLVQKEFPAISHEVVEYLNALEPFAIFFASGVAAEEVGYREAGTAFCRSVEQCMAAFFIMRLVNVRYESVFKLYEMWRDRMKAEKISTQIKALENDAKRLSKETIKPIGT